MFDTFDVCFISSFIFFVFLLVCRIHRYLYPLSVSTSFILSVLVGMPSAGSNFPLCAITFADILIPNFVPISFFKMATVLTNVSFSVFAYILRSSMYSKWLSLYPLFNVYPNFVWFNMMLMGFNATHKRKGGSVSPWNISHFVGLLSVFHILSAAYSIGSWIHLSVLLSSC